MREEEGKGRIHERIAGTGSACHILPLLRGFGPPKPQRGEMRARGVSGTGRVGTTGQRDNGSTGRDGSGQRDATRRYDTARDNGLLWLLASGRQRQTTGAAIRLSSEGCERMAAQATVAATAATTTTTATNDGENELLRARAVILVVIGGAAAETQTATEALIELLLRQPRDAL